MSPLRSSAEWSKALAQQAAVIELGQLGLRGATVDDLLTAAVRTVARELDCPHIMLFEALDEGAELRGRAGVYRGSVLPPDLAGQIQLPGGTGSLPGFTVSGGEPVVAEDLLGDPRFTTQAPAMRVPAVSAVSAPIAWEQGSWGALCAYHETPRSWTDDEVLFVSSVGATIGLALQREAVERSLRDAVARLDLAVSAGGLGAWSWELNGDRLEASQQVREVYGVPDGAPFDTGTEQLAYVHPDDLDGVLANALDHLNPGDEVHQLFRIRRKRDGEERWVESWGRVLQDDTGAVRLVGVTTDITDRRSAEERREALLTAEREARRGAEVMRERLRLLGEASQAFAASLDPTVVAASLVRCCIPQLADGCLVDVLDEHGHLVEAGGGAIDPGLLDDMRELRRRRRAQTDERVWAQSQVLAANAPVAIERISDRQLQEAAVDDAHFALLERFEARAALVVPLTARGEAIGTVTLVGNGARNGFDADQRALVDELAGRAALALDNCRLFAARHRVARSLQDALLPPVLPEVPGVDLAARYQVAEDDIDIGGDFYDVMEVAGGAWGIVLGDVCGRGPDAAALTGLIRHSVRAAAVREHLPSRVLGLTNDAVIDQIDDARFCTATFVRVEPAPGGTGVRVQLASAGHPRPLVRRAHGVVELVDAVGALLGVIEEPILQDRTIELAPGDALVLYTDGVTEARRAGEFFGEERLADAVQALEVSSAECLAAGIEAAVTDFRDGATDDLAVVVLLARPATG